MRRVARIAIGVVALGGLAAGGVVLAGGGENAQVAEQGATKDDSRAPVDVTAVEVGTLSSYIETTANLVAEKQVVVVAEAQGRVTKLSVNEGDVVRSGALLANLSAKDAKLSVTRAQIQFRGAEKAQDRAALLAKQGAVSDEEVENLTKDRDVAAHDLTEARVTLGKTKIKAPFDGRVTRTDVVPGQYVNPGESLLELTSFDSLIADIHIPERDALFVASGRPVELRLEAQDEVEFHGRVRHVGSTVNVESGTVRVTIEVQNPPPEVRSGSFVHARLVRRTHEQARWLAREAVVQGGSGPHVFVVDGEIVHRRPVTTGVEDGGRLEILEGLEPGDQVVVRGQGALSDGAPIKVDADTRTAKNKQSEATEARASDVG
jgi:RND family efflux transporter MFP subunit